MAATANARVGLEPRIKFNALLSLLLHMRDVFGVVISLSHLYICKLSHSFEQHMSLQHRLIRRGNGDLRR